jgi:hypothetical protein
MKADLGKECLEVIEDGCNGFVVGGEAEAIDQLMFESAPERLHVVLSQECSWVRRNRARPAGSYNDQP